MHSKKASQRLPDCQLNAALALMQRKCKRWNPTLILDMLPQFGENEQPSFPFSCVITDVA